MAKGKQIETSEVIEVVDKISEASADAQRLISRFENGHGLGVGVSLEDVARVNSAISVISHFNGQLIAAARIKNPQA